MLVGYDSKYIRLLANDDNQLHVLVLTWHIFDADYYACYISGSNVCQRY